MLSKILKTLAVLLVVTALTTLLLGVKTIYNTDTPVKTVWTDLKNNHYNPKPILTHMKKTPKKEQYTLLHKVSDYTPTKEKVYIVFKYGCPDCEAMTEYIMSKYKTIKNDNYEIAFVNAETELGEKLIKDFGLTSVPTLIYVKNVKENDYNVTVLMDQNKVLQTNIIDQYFAANNISN